MSRQTKYISLTVLVLFVLACNAVTQPFNQLGSAKDSLKQSEDKQKAALEEADKEIK